MENTQETNVELVKKLGALDQRIKELEAEKQYLLIEYNNIIMELWERVPPLKETGGLAKKLK